MGEVKVILFSISSIGRYLFSWKALKQHMHACWVEPGALFWAQNNTKGPFTHQIHSEKKNKKMKDVKIIKKSRKNWIPIVVRKIDSGNLARIRELKKHLNNRIKTFISIPHVSFSLWKYTCVRWTSAWQTQHKTFNHSIHTLEQ